MIRSLRMRLFLGVTAVSLLVLGALAVAIDQAVHHTLQEEFDRVLLEKARTISSLVEQSGDKTHFDFQPAQFPEFEPGPKSSYFEVSLDAQPFQHSASLSGAHLPATPLENNTWTVQKLTLPDGRQGRQLTLAFQPLIELDESGAGVPNPLPQGLVAVAQDSSTLDRTLAKLRLLTITLCAGATLLSGIALILTASRAVRPVRALARQIDALKETDLSPTLAPGDFPTELAPVVDRLNGLLTRLGDAFTRERAFTADVAHELRTPIAGMLATLQVARTRPRDPASYETSIDKSLIILNQMQAMVENLLLLARAESGQLAVRRAPVDLLLLIQECQLAFDDAAIRRNLTFALTTGDLPPVQADREMLRLAVANLLDNAVSYALPGTVITIQISADPTTAAIEIANLGHSLKESDLPNLLKRFVRKDPARSATGIHAGLGLSICQRLMTLQNGRLTLRLDAGTFIARVELETAPRASLVEASSRLA